MSTATDPTLSFVELFDDQSNWSKIVRRVPIFIPHAVRHKRRGPDGKVLKDKDGNDIEDRIEVNEERLRRIADTIKENWQKNGVPVRFIEGHTKDPYEVDQEKQPEIHAYGINAEVGYWGPDKKLGILVDQYILPGHLDQVKKFPFRSSEFNSRTNEISAVALLRTDPKLDMGVIFYHDTPNFASGTAHAAQFYPTFGFDPKHPLVFCYMKTEIDMPDPTKPPMADDNNKPGEGAGDDFDNKFKGAMSKNYPHFEKYYNEVCAKKYMAPAPGSPAPGGAAPSATNGSVPGSTPPPPAKPAPYGDDTIPDRGHRMTPTEWQLQEKLRAAEEREKAAAHRARRAEAKEIVNQLQYQEGYYIPEPEELVEELALMDDDKQKFKIKEIRQCYQKDPAAGSLVPADNTPRFTRDLTKDEVTEVVLYGEAHNIDTTNDDGFKKARQEWYKNRQMARI